MKNQSLFPYVKASINKNKLRIIVSQLLLFFCLVFLGAVLIGRTSNNNIDHINKLKENNINHTVLKVNNILHIWPYPEGTFEYYYSDTQVKKFKEYFGIDEPITIHDVRYERYYNLGERPDDLINIDKNIKIEEEEYERTPYNVSLHSKIKMVMEIDPEGDYLDLVPDSRLEDKSVCHLPNTYEEVALTGLKADMYLKHGYIDEEGKTWKFEKIDDLIGKKLDKMTICGIYEIKDEPLSFIKSFNSPSKDPNAKTMTDLMASGEYLSEYAIVKKGTYRNYLANITSIKNDHIYGFVIDISKTDPFGAINSLSYRTNYNEYTSYVLKYSRKDYSYGTTISSPYTYLFTYADQYKTYWFFNMFITLAVIFGLASSVMISQLLSSILNNKEDEKLGKTDSYKALAVLSLSMIVMPLIISVAFMPLACFLLNRQVIFNAFHFTFPMFGYMLLCSIGIIALASLKPLIQIARKTKKEKKSIDLQKTRTAIA